MFVQGPGFNIGAAALEALGARLRAVAAVPATACPDYTFLGWGCLLPRYPPAVKELHQFSVASFFLSRFDGAFYRQFGLTNITDKKRFEVGVAERLCAALSDETADTADGELSRALSVASSIAEQLRLLPEDCFHFACDRSGGSEEQWLSVYEKWSRLSLDAAPCCLRQLSSVLIQALQDLEPQPTVKEYDGFVAHCMIRAETDPTRPSEEEHFRLLSIVLSDDTCTPDVYVRSLRDNLRAMLRRGRLHVVHDIGLDPMVDDFLALKILHFLLLMF